MIRFRAKLALSLATVAMVALPVSSVSARPLDWGAPRYGNGYGYPYRYGRHPYYRRDNSGAVIGALLGVGLIAAVAASASKASRARTDRDSRDYRDDDFRDRDDPRYRDNGAYSDPRAYEGREEIARYESGTAGSSDEDAAVDACALAARDEGSRNGYFAEVRDITDTRRTNDGGYTVLGTLDQRSSYRGVNGLPRAFSCSWSDGEARVRLS